MSLPALSNWDSTRVSLHHAAQVVGAVCATVNPPEPNYLHLALRVAKDGLTSRSTSVGELLLNIRAGKLLLHRPGAAAIEWELARFSQSSLADEVERVLAEHHSDLRLHRDKLHAGPEMLEIDLALAADYAHVLTHLTAIFERFRATLPGDKTPLVVWPHGFDQSFLWFATPESSEHAPHLSFGFSPYSAGLEQPYIYAYAYPVPAGLTLHQLSSPAHWHTEGWTGLVLSYDDISQSDSPDQVVERTLRQFYDIVSLLLPAG